jgi:hypothetical protein
MIARGMATGGVSMSNASCRADVVYDSGEVLAAEELVAFYERQNHRTTGNLDKIRRMLANTNCIVTARRGGELIGFARGVTDGVWGCLLECKLDPRFQGPACVTRTDGRIEHDTEGIARSMALRVIDALRGEGAERIDVIAHETEMDFCEELGFHRTRVLEVLELPGGASLSSGPVEVAVGAEVG